MTTIDLLRYSQAKKLFPYSKRKRKQTGLYQIWIQIWKTPISITFPTCTDVLPLYRQNDQISHYLNQTLFLYPSQTYTSFHHTFPVHHFAFLDLNLFLKNYIHFLPNFTCTSKLLIHPSTNHLHYFRNYNLLNWNISHSYVTPRSNCRLFAVYWWLTVVLI